MAIVASPVWNVSISVKDRENKKADVSFSMDAAIAAADLEGIITGDIIPVVDALTNGVVVGWSMSRSAQENTNPQAPEASDVQRKGVFLFKAENGAPYKLELPSLDNAFVVDGSDVLNPAATEVAALVAFVLGVGAVTGQEPRTYLNALITQANGAKKRHRRSSEV